MQRSYLQVAMLNLQLSSRARQEPQLHSRRNSQSFLLPLSAACFDTFSGYTQFSAVACKAWVPDGSCYKSPLTFKPQPPPLCPPFWVAATTNTYTPCMVPVPSMSRTLSSRCSRLKTTRALHSQCIMLWYNVILHLLHSGCMVLYACWSISR